MISDDPEKYGAVFMDVQMPEMDGYEATRRIRELEETWPHHRPLPVIAMTANVFREDIEKALEAGMDDHIGKPLDFNEVLEKLRHYLPGAKHDFEAEKDGAHLSWSPDLVTGNSVIDSQHKQIFRLANNFAAACKSGRGKTMLGETLDFLASYVIRHFSEEEALQEASGYPGREEHKQFHEAFRTAVGDLIADYKKEKASAGDSLEALLERVNTVVVRWFMEHIKREDLKMAAHVSSRSGGPPE
jgi:hemerythrin-like metal-binding protein